MSPRYLRVTDVCVQLEIDDQFFRRVCEEGLIEIKHTVEDEQLMSADDAERLRLISVLVRELDVNLPGAEVILHLCDDLKSMQRQFDEILHTLVGELRGRMSGRGDS